MSKKENYFNAGETWENEVVANAIQSRNRAWIIAFSCLGISFLALLTLILILPLKTFEPYVITVDQNTGYYEVSRGLNDSNLTSDQAITESNLVRYVTLREQYNPAILENNYKEVMVMSDGAALKQFRDLWGDNPQNPSRKLGTNSAIDIKIKSVAFIGDKVAQVRFVKERKSNEGLKISHWNAVLEFQYTQKPTKMLERFQNPLGFKVINYRVNPETLETTR